MGVNLLTIYYTDDGRMDDRSIVVLTRMLHEQLHGLPAGVQPAVPPLLYLAGESVPQTHRYMTACVDAVEQSLNQGELFGNCPTCGGKAWVQV